MKHLLLTTIAAVVLVGCGPSEADRALFKAVAGVELGDTSVQLGGREHEERNIEAVKQHLDAGAEVDAKDDKFVGTFLHWAAAGGQDEIVELLIAAGADVNATDGDGDTPLHLAGNNTATKVIAELLIAKGADVNAMNLSPPGREIGGMTPLDMATLGNRTEIANLIRKHGGKTGAELKAEGN